MFGGSATNKLPGEDDDFEDDVKGNMGGSDSDLSSNDLDLPSKKKKRVNWNCVRYLV
jgi:hypothetical protein